MQSIPQIPHRHFEDWWSRDPEWRDQAHAFLAERIRCEYCGVKPRSLQAIPRDRADPFHNLLAVCGQCKVAARRYTVVPEEFASRPTVGPAYPWEVAAPKKRRR